MIFLSSESRSTFITTQRRNFSLLCKITSSGRSGLIHSLQQPIKLVCSFFWDDFHLVGLILAPWVNWRINEMPWVLVKLHEMAAGQKILCSPGSISITSIFVTSAAANRCCPSWEALEVAQALLEETAWCKKKKERLSSVIWAGPAHASHQLGRSWWEQVTLPFLNLSFLTYQMMILMSN